MGPVGRVPSNFGDHEDQLYLIPSSFCNWLPFCRGKVLWEADLLSKVKSRGEGKKSREGNG